MSRCMCRGLHFSKGLSRKQVALLHRTAKLWYEAKPFLRLRLNHVIRLDVPWATEYKYAYVLGGGGNCPVGMGFCTSWEDIRNMEVEHSQRPYIKALRLVLEHGDEMPDEYLQYIVRAGLPVVAGPEVAATRVHRTSDNVYPVFHWAEDHRAFRLANPNELAFVHAAMHAIVLALQEGGLLQSPEDSPTGDYRM